MTLFKLDDDLDRGTTAYMKDRTRRLSREAPMPGVRYGQEGRSYPGCDEPRFDLRAWLQTRLKLKVR